MRVAAKCGSRPVRAARGGHGRIRSGRAGRELLQRVEQRAEVREDVADQGVDQPRVQVRVGPNEVAEAEGLVVERQHELPELVERPPHVALVVGERRRRHPAGVFEAAVDGVRGHLPALQRHEEPGGEDRIEERERVAREAEAVAADRLRAVAELPGDPDRLHPRAAAQVVFDPDAVGRLTDEDRLRVARVAIQVVRLGDDADADDVVRQRDVPEPALLRDVGDRRRALVESGGRASRRGSR